MSQSKRPLPISRAAFHALYEQGEEALYALFSEQLVKFEQLETRLTDLENRLSKTSRNSSKPPSGDGFGKRTKSLRTKSDKPSGGQSGHPGSTLEWSESVDCFESYPVTECSGCGDSLTQVPAVSVLKRQVFDIPKIELQVTEHQAEVKCCPQCGQETVGDFPVGANTVVQYGPRLKAMMVYLMAGQLLPSARIGEVLRDLLGICVSEGTLYNARRECFEGLDDLELEIQDALVTSKVAHFDETGLRVNGQLWWLHVACTNGLTYYFIHPRRGQAAMEEMAILPHFEGKALHDGWHSYRQYECEHFLCNAHHLRELQFILERYQQGWAYQMSLLLGTIYRQVQNAKAKGQNVLGIGERQAFEDRYATILQAGFATNLIPEPPPDADKKRGRPKHSIPYNLLERLRVGQEAVLGFMHDFTVPFDNNQAERDLRMIKLKQKISGCFRSEDGATMFCRIRGVFSTLRKQNRNLVDTLVALFSGHPISLLTQPE